MKPFFILNKRILFVLFLSLVLFILFCSQFAGYAIDDKNGDTHKKRIDFISNLGYAVDEDSVTSKQVIIPNTFSKVYSKYNDLQQVAGYDLSNYKGNKVTQYRYKLLGFKDQSYCINLLVFNGIIIGGDVSSVNLYGEILPLLNCVNNTK